MASDELKEYIRKSLGSGYALEEVRKSILAAGWQERDIREAVAELGAAEPVTAREGGARTNNRRVFVFSLIILTVALGVAGAYLWQDRLDLADTNAKKVREFYTRLAESQISFTDAGAMVFPDEQKFMTAKAEYLRFGTSFVEIDLRMMQLTLYERGAALRTMDVLTKGKERSWWETPTGNYTVLGKSANAFSSIGNVWMPWSIQFYGNYFIHGWPYYEGGAPVPQGYSGGCIRLATKDAKDVFDFVKVGTPVLVLEDAPEESFGVLALRSATAARTAPPSVGAKAFLIADLASGDRLLEKRADEPLPIASLTKLMTAVVSHEVIYLGRFIKVTPQMLASVSQIFYPAVGGRYIGLDLLYPLLMQSSNATARVLSGFVGDAAFVDNMNAKADSLRMGDTKFADAAGISPLNIATAADLSRLLQYIYYKRPFLFDISKGISFENVGLIPVGDTINIAELKNVNEFVGRPDLIGVKNGETTAARQTLATVWNLRTGEGDVPVAIIVLGSEDRERDTEELLRWLKNTYEVRSLTFWADGAPT